MHSWSVLPLLCCILIATVAAHAQTSSTGEPNQRAQAQTTLLQTTQSRPKASGATTRSRPASRPTTSGRATTGPTTTGRATSRPTTAQLPAATAADFGPFRLSPPAQWKTKLAPIAAGFRKAAYILPGAPEQSADCELVVFLFKGGAGSVEMNLARWKGQMQKPAGLSDDEHCIFSKQVVDGLPITIAEIRGDYQSDPRNPTHVTKGQMMLSAIIETSQGNYFIRTIGPEATMQKYKDAWYKMMLTIQAENHKDN